MPELLDSVPRLHPSAGVQRVGDRLLAAGPGEWLHVFEHEDGSPSDVAERIVQLVDGQRTVGAIAAMLAHEFEVDIEHCQRDTAEFVSRLLGRDLLVLVRSKEGADCE